MNYAIEPTRSRRQGRVDGLETPRHRADAATGTRRVDGVISTQVWDIEKGSESASCDEHKQLIQDIVWDHEGKVWATSSKDKKLRLGDPRSKSIVGEIDQAHAGAKSTKLSFLGGFDRLCSVGFTKQSQRQIKFWDVRCPRLSILAFGRDAVVASPGEARRRRRFDAATPRTSWREAGSTPRINAGQEARRRARAPDSIRSGVRRHHPLLRRRHEGALPRRQGRRQH